MNPIYYIILGIILFLLGTYLPNGVELFNYVESITIYNFLITMAQGLGAGLVVGGVILFIKRKLMKKS